MSIVPLLKNICTHVRGIYYRFEVSDQLWFYRINDEINCQMGNLTRTALFFNENKAKFWVCWMNVSNKPALDNIFQRYSNCTNDIFVFDL